MRSLYKIKPLHETHLMPLAQWQSEVHAFIFQGVSTAAVPMLVDKSAVGIFSHALHYTAEFRKYGFK
jgi:hypothetical protein